MYESRLQSRTAIRDVSSIRADDRKIYRMTISRWLTATLGGLQPYNLHSKSLSDDLLASEVYINLQPVWHERKRSGHVPGETSKKKHHFPRDNMHHYSVSHYIKCLHFKVWYILLLATKLTFFFQQKQTKVRWSTPMPKMSFLSSEKKLKMSDFLYVWESLKQSVSSTMVGCGRTSHHRCLFYPQPVEKKKWRHWGSIQMTNELCYVLGWHEWASSQINTSPFKESLLGDEVGPRAKAPAGSRSSTATRRLRQGSLVGRRPGQTMSELRLRTSLSGNE